MDTLTLIAQACAAGLRLRGEGDRLIVNGPRSAAYLVPSLREYKTEVLARLAKDDAEVAWRITAFRTALSQHGQIWPPKVRSTPQTDTQGHCSLCGDVLPADSAPRFVRCQLCIQALWRVLDERDGVEIKEEMTTA